MGTAHSLVEQKRGGATSRGPKKSIIVVVVNATSIAPMHDDLRSQRRARFPPLSSIFLTPPSPRGDRPATSAMQTGAGKAVFSREKEGETRTRESIVAAFFFFFFFSLLTSLFSSFASFHSTNHHKTNHQASPSSTAGSPSATRSSTSPSSARTSPRSTPSTST